MQKLLFNLGFASKVWAFLVISWALNATAYAQEDGRIVLNRIESAIASGNANTLRDLATNPIFVRTAGEMASYSPAQAWYVLKDFFKTAAPKSGFRFNDVPSLNGNAVAASGDYRDTNGKSYRVQVRIRKENNRWDLREIRFNPND